MQRLQPMERGSSFVAIRNYVRNRFGSEGEKQMLSLLSQDLVQTYSEAVPTGWYPVEHTRLLLEAVYRMCNEDPQVIFEIGRTQAREDIKGIVRFLVLFATPHQLIKRSSKLWSQFVNTGSMSYVKLGAQSCEIVLTDYFNGKLNCIMSAGVMEELASCAGAKEVKVEEVECVGDGAEACRWKVSWAG